MTAARYEGSSSQYQGATTQGTGGTTMPQGGQGVRYEGTGTQYRGVETQGTGGAMMGQSGSQEVRALSPPARVCDSAYCAPGSGTHVVAAVQVAGMSGGGVTSSHQHTTSSSSQQGQYTTTTTTYHYTTSSTSSASAMQTGEQTRTTTSSGALATGAQGAAQTSAQTRGATGASAQGTGMEGVGALSGLGGPDSRRFRHSSTMPAGGAGGRQVVVDRMQPIGDVVIEVRACCVLCTASLALHGVLFSDLMSPATCRGRAAVPSKGLANGESQRESSAGGRSAGPRHDGDASDLGAG